MMWRLVVCNWYFAQVNENNYVSILIGKPEIKNSLDSLELRCEDDIKIDFCSKCELGHNKVKW
jgi:hypothetical protein